VDIMEKQIQMFQFYKAGLKHGYKYVFKHFVKSYVLLGATKIM